MWRGAALLPWPQRTEPRQTVPRQREAGLDPHEKELTGGRRSPNGERAPRECVKSSPRSVEAELGWAVVSRPAAVAMLVLPGTVGFLACEHRFLQASPEGAEPGLSLTLRSAVGAPR